MRKNRGWKVGATRRGCARRGHSQYSRRVRFRRRTCAPLARRAREVKGKVVSRIYKYKSRRLQDLVVTKESLAKQHRRRHEAENRVSLTHFLKLTPPACITAILDSAPILAAFDFVPESVILHRRRAGPITQHPIYYVCAALARVPVLSILCEQVAKCRFVLMTRKD